MKLQSSLEFLLIMGVVAGLSISAVSFYNSTLSKGNGLLKSINLSNFSAQTNLNVQKSLTPIFLFYVPTNSTTNQSNLLQVASIGCSNGVLNVNFNSTDVVFSNKYAQITLNGTSFNTTYFTPESSGYHPISIFYNYSCNNQTKVGFSQYLTFSSDRAHLINGSIQYALISNRSEHISYSVVSAGNIATLNEFNHCTYSGPFGPAGIGGQCGTTNAWEYSVFSDYCYTQSNYYTLTYCVIPSLSNYSISYPDPSNYTLNYTFTLSLSTVNGTLIANVFQNSSSQLMLNNRAVGRVKVISANGAAQLGDQFLISNTDSSWTIDPSAYATYLQTKNNLYSILSFYNKSEVSTDLQSTLESGIVAYVKASNGVINATRQISKCNIINSKYECNSLSPFYYILMVNASGIGLKNQTLEYQGSTIQISNK